jgi:hypothetical protein
VPELNSGGNAVDAQLLPLEVSTLPDVPGATKLTEDVPFPRITLLSVRVVLPVPPYAAPTALALQVPVVTLPTPVIPVYDPEIRAEATVPDEMLEAFMLLMADPSPVNEEPVIAPALNSPDVPRSTIVEAPLALAAVVLALSIVPAEMLDALILVMVNPAPIKLAADTLPVALTLPAVE